MYMVAILDNVEEEEYDDFVDEFFGVDTDYFSVTTEQLNTMEALNEMYN